MSIDPPIISICIPTFNRSKTLDALLGDIEILKLAHDSKVEICISNNCSTDNTIEIIEKWSRLFQIRFINQVENVGATRNLQRVATMASGKWILLIGDDDGINNSEFEKLLDILSGTPDDCWNITLVANSEQETLYFSKNDVGLYSPAEFLNKLLQCGTIYIGFIGCHIFSNEMSRQLHDMNADQIRPWPHIALMLGNLTSIKTNIVECMPVIQAARESQLFWSSGDWVRNKLRLIDLLMTYRSQDIKFKCILDNIIQKEMCSRSLVKEFIKWRITEGRDYANNARLEYILRLNKMERYNIFHKFILESIDIIGRVSDRAIGVLLCLVGKPDFVENYMNIKRKQTNHSGVWRKM